MSPSPQAAAGPATTALVGVASSAVALCCALRAFVPVLPAPGLDPAWQATLGEMAERGALWGRDVAFTYGPASPLVTGYPTEAFLSRTLPVLVALALGFGGAAALLLAGPGRGRSGALAGAGVLALALAACGLPPDGFLLALPSVLVLAHLARGGAAPALAGALGAAALGFAALSKTSLPIATLPVLLVGDAAALARRRVPPFAAPFLVGALAGAPLHGLPLDTLPDYLRLQGEVVAGYAGAMSYPGLASDTALFALAALGLLLAAARGARARGGPAWAAPAALALTLFFLFKAGFVRHDLHAVLAWDGAALLAVLLARGWLPPGDRASASATVAAALLAVYGYAPALALMDAGLRADPRAVVRADLARLARGGGEVAAAARFARDPAAAVAARRADKARAFAAIARAAPLGPLPGPVDILPSEQARVMANGLNFRPRPSFQEYGTYTPALAEANRAFLEGSRAPRWFLFGPEASGTLSIDDRYPNLAEGPLWLDLLSLYRPDHRIGGLLALERRGAPAPVRPGPESVREIAPGTFAPVAGEAPVWARVELRLNGLGRLAALLYHPPTPVLALRFADGREARYRFVPGIGAAGFLLSPRIDDAPDFAALAEGRAAPPGRRVTAFAVELPGAGRLFYDAGLRIATRPVALADDGPLPPPVSASLAP